LLAPMCRPKLGCNRLRRGTACTGDFTGEPPDLRRKYYLRRDQSGFESLTAFQSIVYIYIYTRVCGGGAGSSVGIATDYRLDGPGSNPCVDEIFCPSRPALGPTQPPPKLVPGLSRG